ncbi:MAG: alpha-galactosidase, partial [Pseudomonadota bacterium]
MTTKRLILVGEGERFHLTNGSISYAFRASPEGILEHLHFGKAVPNIENSALEPRRPYRAATLEYEAQLNYLLDDIPQEYPVFGRSDNRVPTLHGINADGNSTLSPLYSRYEISSEKPLLSGLPSARSDNSETLTVFLKDSLFDLEIRLQYTVYAEHDVITRSVELINGGDQPISLNHVYSTNLDLCAGDYDLLHFRGSWAREFEQERHAVPHGRFVVESNKGASSNAHNPTLVVMPKTTDEHHGESVSFALLYSGNFAFNVEKSEFEAVRINAGISPFNFSWKLNPGRSFVCPEVAQVYCDSGLNGMSQIWHSFINQQIVPTQFVDIPRPTYLNSWEAHYFDISEESLVSLAETTRDLGVEMLVLDDGWFKGRDDDKTSLGDWFADERKFPKGVVSAAKQVKEMGLKFGLWFEPEMVSEQSDLFASHPDWIVQVPNRKPSTGRQQYILDLSNASVREYLFERLHAFLSSGEIDYVKWDMNRTMTEVGSTAWSKEQQQEVAHRYMLGVYELVSKITEAFPQVLFENCASGGNRFDLGMLTYMAQGWVSDMSEPIGRLEIFNGASYFYPASTMASYIGPQPSHQNGRAVSLQTRADVAFFCAARGLSLNRDDLLDNNEALKSHLSHYKSTAQDVVEGQLYRLLNDGNQVAWQLTSRDGKRVYLGYFHILSKPNLPLRRIKLIGLNSDAKYRLVQPAWQHGQPSYSGAELGNYGF